MPAVERTSPLRNLRRGLLSPLKPQAERPAYTQIRISGWRRYRLRDWESYRILGKTYECRLGTPPALASEEWVPQEQVACPVPALGESHPEIHGPQGGLDGRHPGGRWPQAVP